MNNQGNKDVQEENEKSQETKLEAMEDCNLNDREFKMAIMKKLNEIQKDTERQFNSPRMKLVNRGVHYQRD